MSSPHAAYPWSKGRVPLRGEATRDNISNALEATLNAVKGGGKKMGHGLPGGKAELRAARIASKRASRAVSGEEGFDPTELLDLLLAKCCKSGVEEEVEEEEEGSKEHTERATAAAAAGEQDTETDWDEEGPPSTPSSPSPFTVTTEPLSVTARVLALRLASLVGFRGVEGKGGGGKKSKRRITFIPSKTGAPSSSSSSPPPFPTPTNLAAAWALCNTFARQQTGGELEGVVAKQREARKVRRERKAAQHVSRSKASQRFVSEGGAGGGGGGGGYGSSSDDSASGSSSDGGESEEASECGSQGGAKEEDTPFSLDALLKRVTFVEARGEEEVVGEEGGGEGKGGKVEGDVEVLPPPTPPSEPPQHTPLAPPLPSDDSPSPSPPSHPPPLVGEWEVHTRGFGSRLLSKMGYNGGNLGRNRVGPILRPFDSVARSKGEGIGYL